MTEQVRTATAPTPTKRVPVWDNARFICVTLVVIGHGIQRLTAESDAALALYLFIYAWHIPAFAIISGYFSKPGPPNNRQMKRVLTDILLPYVIMESIWTLVQWLVEGKADLNPTRPSWTLWFLLALGIFRLVLPYLSLIRWPLAWAVLLSMGVGYLENIDHTFSLARAIGILPYFVLGWKVKEWGWAERWRTFRWNSWWVRSVAVAVLGGWMLAIIINIEQWREFDLRYWFFYDRSYAALGEVVWWDGLLRLALIGLAVLLSAAFFVLVPRRRTWMTDFGQATMYVYLLHSFVLYPIRETGVLGGETSSTMWLVGMVLACIAISIALSSTVVRKIFRPLVEPKPHWFFVDRDSGKPGSSRVDPTGSRRS
jgi:fucose 4-O-acetylase-like acetyltransferase